MEQIIEYIKQKYSPLTIIVYGSYASGTNNLNSDFDALVISQHHREFHDTSFVNGVQLDVFVYPNSYFDGDYDLTNLDLQRSLLYEPRLCIQYSYHGYSD